MYVIATQRLEGIKLDKSTIEDLKRVARGEITTDDIRKKIIAEIKNS